MMNPIDTNTPAGGPLTQRQPEAPDPVELLDPGAEIDNADDTEAAASTNAPKDPPLQTPCLARNGSFWIEAAIPEQMDLLMQWRRRVLEDVFADSFPKDLQQADALMEENRRYYQHQLGQGHRAYWVRHETGDIVGCGGICLYQEMPSPDNPNGRCSYFMNIYTLPEFRHQGAASLLVRTLIQESYRLKAGKIYLETSDAGRAVYQELGFHEMKGYLKYGE